MHVTFRQGVFRHGVIRYRGVIALDCLYFNDFSIRSHSLVSNGLHFMKHTEDL